MDLELFESLADPKNDKGRKGIDRRIFKGLDDSIIANLNQLVDTELKALLIQALYDLDEYYFLLGATFKDEKQRPNLHLKCKISGHRLDIEWLRYWSFTDPVSGKRTIYSRSFRKGKTARHSMSGFSKYPVELKRIINFMESRNEIKRKRGAILSKISQLIRMYEKVTKDDIY